MKTVGLNDITETDFNESARLVIDILRTGYPKLDLRKGTVLRDLLVNPDGTVGAVMSKQVEECRNSTSLVRMMEAKERGEEVDPDDVKAVLSNFDMGLITGTKATGQVRIIVEYDRDYTIMKGFRFTTLDRLEFEVTTTVSVSTSPTDGQARLYVGNSNFWFTVPVVCTTVGVAGNLGQGVTLNPQSSIFGFVSAAAYKTFSGGSDLEALDKTIDRIKPSLSVRGLVNGPAVEAQLRDRFDNGDHPIVAVSTCGYGNDAQLRDKHNLFGVAVGGRADVYVRNFTNIPTMVATKTGNPVDGVPNSYWFDIPSDEMPGMYYVHRVSDPESNALASYEYSVQWFVEGLDGTWHDIMVENDTREVANTIWRKARVTVKNVEPPESGEPPEFRVEMICLPDAKKLQDFVDDREVRNVGADFIVRCPVIVQMSISASVRYTYGTPFDVDTAISKICEYVNTAGFVGRITRSEIATILRNLGARSVDLFDESKMLYGFGFDALGNKFELSGDALDIANARNPKTLVTEDTCVFVVEPSNVQIKTIPV